MRRVLILIVLTLGLVLPRPAVAAWAHVQTSSSSTAANADTDWAQAYGSNVTAGSLLVCEVGWYNTPTVSSVADGTNTWTKIGATVTVASTGGNWNINLWYAMNAASGATTVTTTFSANPTIVHMICSEFSGIATSSALDQQRSDSAQTDPGTATDAVTSGATSATGANNELVVGASIAPPNAGTTTYAAGTSYTIPTNGTGNDGTWMAFALEYMNLASAGAATATFTLSGVGAGTADTATIVATFKEPAAGVTSKPCGQLLLGVSRPCP